MKDHYNISDSEYEKLLKSGVTIANLVMSVPEFQAEECAVNKVSLMYFVDKHGDFTEKNDKLSKIANACFNSLPIRDQIAVGEYIDHMTGE